MTIDLSHLAAPVKEQAFQDAKTRIHLAQTARWVGFTRAQMAVDELEKRYYYPTSARMPCMLLYGDSGMGKTMILEKIERQHPSTLDERRQIKLRPVLTAQMPRSPDERHSIPEFLRFWQHPTQSVTKLERWRVAPFIYYRSSGLDCCLSTRFII